MILSPIFDFAVGEFVTENGAVVLSDGISSVKSRIEKLIRTPLSGDYGLSALNLLGTRCRYEQLKSSLESEIPYKIKKFIPEVTAVSDLSVSANGRRVSVSLNVITSAGKENVYVTIA